MEFLENNCSNKSIPTIGDIKNFFKSHFKIIEEVYDFWLDKRLRRNGEKLIHQILIGKLPQSRSIKKSVSDPYVAFRPRAEKMRLRKNRARDCENYRQMMQLRNSMNLYVQACHSVAEKEKLKHDLLKAKYAIFEESYRREDYSSVNIEQNDDLDLNFLISKYKEDNTNNLVEEHCDDEIPNIPSKDVLQNPYPLMHKTGNKYHKVYKFKFFL